MYCARYQQASIAFEYCEAVFQQSPNIAQLDHQADDGHPVAEQWRGHRGAGRELSSAKGPDLPGRDRR
jgi:hypothetical protein